MKRRSNPTNKKGAKHGRLFDKTPKNQEETNRRCQKTKKQNRVEWLKEHPTTMMNMEVKFTGSVTGSIG